MEDFLLRKSWKNDIFECVQEADLNPVLFRWTEEPTEDPGQSYTVSALEYLGSDAYFKFDRISDGGFFNRFSPGKYKSSDRSLMPLDWDGTLGEFREWLTYLKQENAPDLWEQMKEYAPNETFIGTAEISNAPFSYSETENIIESLDKLQAQIEKNFNLQGEQLAFVKRQIEYLKEGAKRQGKKDWVHTSIGVIATVAMGLALSPEKAKLLWDLVKSCFAGLLQLPAP